jgi:tartrate dehydrogenase/decarboxylase / D-malate dehydrogenase
VSQTFDWSTDYYKKHGVLMPENGREQLLKFDAIYFGALGAPDVPDHTTLWDDGSRFAGPSTDTPQTR